jgi:hypothetical protein
MANSHSNNLSCGFWNESWNRGVISGLCFLVMAAGCTPANEIKRLEAQLVTGRITVGGQPAAGARVVLHPLNAEVKSTGLYPYGVADANGTFYLTSYVRGDGAPPGEYQVSVVWPDETYVPKSPQEAEEIRMGGQPPDRLKGRYATPEKMNLKLVVERGAGVQLLPGIELP